MDIRVSADGTLEWRGRRLRCALGRAGVTDVKREGDGATPAGCFALRRVYYRPDRGAPPETALPVSATDPARHHHARASCRALRRSPDGCSLMSEGLSE